MTSPGDVPLVYALGRTMFLGVELLVAPGALVPRAETELLGRTAIDLALRVRSARPDGAVSIIDMCCGSGNLACAIARHVPGARVWASDLTDGCVDLARRNVAHLGLDAVVTVVQGDLFAPLSGAGLGDAVDLVVCNPPYISSGKLASESASLLAHEPREAFDGGPYGLSIHQRVLKDALPFLRDGGHLAFEIGAGQDRQLRLLFDRARAYGELDLVADDQGRARVVVGRKGTGQAPLAGPTER